MKKMNKKADMGMDTLIPGRLIVIILILVVLIFVLFGARAYMLYQIGLADTGVVQHFYLESKLFENPKFEWSPAETKSNNIYLVKSERKVTLSREPGDLSLLSCPVVAESELSKVNKVFAFDPAYNGTEAEPEIFYNGETIKESDISFKLSDKLTSPHVLTRKKDTKATFDERMAIVKKPENGFLIVAKLADDYPNDNVVRAYISSSQSPTYKKMSHLLACSIMNSFITNSKEGITGVSIIEIVPKTDYEKLLNVDKPAIILEVSNLNFVNGAEQKGINFAISDSASESLSKGIDSFFSSGAKVNETSDANTNTYKNVNAIVNTDANTNVVNQKKSDAAPQD